MALTLSSMMELGTQAPDFTLLNTLSNQSFTLSAQTRKTATVVVFLCNHCPFVHHINAQLVHVAQEYQNKDIQFIGISSNDVENYPQDSPDEMQKTGLKEGYNFPYLYDATQEVAKAYKAECTPDFFVFDNQLKCVYRGRFDETRPNMGQPTGIDLIQALDALIANQNVSEDQKPSMGCNIKWKNE